MTETEENVITNASAAMTDMKLEVVIIPVSDVDRAKEFYSKLAWRLDADRAADGFRLIQFTPPASGSSIQFGVNLTTASPGSARGLLLAVSNIEERAGNSSPAALTPARCFTAKPERLADSQA